jgi:hypothetical protein
MIWIDGVQVVNNNFFQGPTARSGSVTLTAGAHDIVIGFYQGGVTYALSADITAVPAGSAIVPGRLSNSRLSYTTSSSMGSLSGAAGSSISLNGSSLTVNQAANGTFAGNITDSVPGNLTKAGAAKLVLTGNNALRAINVNVGELVVEASGALGNGAALTVQGGALVTLKPTGTGTIVPRVGTLSVSGKIDLADDKLITTTAAGTWNGSDYTDTSGLIRAGRTTNNNWSGTTGIVTTQTQATNGSNFTSIGVASASQVIPSTATATALWAGQTVTGTETLVMYTYGGDANLDGKINIDDYGHIDTSIGIGLKGWFNGDFNYDGVINIDDYGIIDVNIGIQGAAFATGGGAVSGLGAVSAVPEPAALMFAPAGALLLARRRRRAVSGARGPSGPRFRCAPR